VDPVRRGRARAVGDGGQLDAGRTEPVEIELVDPAVPPDLILLAGQRGRGERLEGTESPLLQPGQPGQGGNGFRGERGQNKGLSRKEAR